VASPEDYAREMIGRQAMQIIGLRAQLDAAQERIKALEQQAVEPKGGQPSRGAERQDANMPPEA